VKGFLHSAFRLACLLEALAQAGDSCFTAGYYMRDVGGVSSNRMVVDIYNPQSEFRNPQLADSRTFEG
jgi:hypothetical protein